MAQPNSPNVLQRLGSSISNLLGNRETNVVQVSGSGNATELSATTTSADNLAVQVAQSAILKGIEQVEQAGATPDAVASAPVSPPPAETEESSIVPRLPSSIQLAESSGARIEDRITNKSITGRVRTRANGVELMDVDITKEPDTAKMPTPTPELADLLEKGRNIAMTTDLEARINFTLDQFDGTMHDRMEIFVASFQGFLQGALKTNMTDAELQRKIAALRKARSTIIDKVSGNLLAASAEEVEALVQTAADLDSVEMSDDNAQVLELARKALAQAFGDPLRVNVYFSGLSLTAHTANPDAVPRVLRGRNTVFTQSVRMFCMLPIAIGRVVRSRFLRQHLTEPTSILTDCSGVLEAGRLTLLLGPPGAGKSTLLKALQGQVKDVPGRQSYTGKVCYNAHDISDSTFFAPNWAT